MTKGVWEQCWLLHATVWPEDKKFSWKRSLLLREEHSFFLQFKNDIRKIPCLAIFDIQVDLQKELNILNYTWAKADRQRKENKRKWCFSKSDQNHCVALERIIQKWQSLSCKEKDKVRDNKTLTTNNKITMKKMPMHTLNGMTAAMNIQSIVIVFTNTPTLWKLILKFLQVPPRQCLMGSWMNVDSPAVLVKVHLLGTH